MYAIVEIAGQQFKVEEGKKIFVHHLESQKDSIIDFDRVLLVEDNEKILIGEPTVENFIVQGKVIEHVKGDKVIVFKKKRKKGYRVKKGHRQNFSQVEIIGIGEKGKIIQKLTPKREKVKVTKPESIEEPVTEKKPAGKKTASKTPSVKKEVSKPKVKKDVIKKEEKKKSAVKKASKKKE